MLNNLVLDKNRGIVITNKTGFINGIKPQQDVEWVVIHKLKEPKYINKIFAGYFEKYGKNNLPIILYKGSKQETDKLMRHFGIKELQRTHYKAKVYSYVDSVFGESENYAYDCWTFTEDNEPMIFTNRFETIDSVILPYNENDKDIEYKIRSINPNFIIQEGIKIFNGNEDIIDYGYQIFNPYGKINRELFFKKLEMYSKLFSYDFYYKIVIDKDIGGQAFRPQCVNLKNNKKEQLYDINYTNIIKIANILKCLFS